MRVAAVVLPVSVVVVACSDAASPVLVPDPTLSVMTTVSWAVETLPPLGTSTISTFAVSSNGTVAGVASSGTVQSAFLRQPGAAPRSLAPLPGHLQAIATAVNSEGQAAGSSWATDNASALPVFWRVDGVAEPILVPNGRVEAMNNAGWVVGAGSAAAGSNVLFAYRWKRNRLSETLPGLSGSTLDVAFDINDRGYIAGVSGGHPVIWSPDAKPRDLTLPEGAAFGTAVAINERNQVAINVRMNNGRNRSLRWTPETGYRFLPLPPGATFTFALGIDDSGNVYGLAPGTSFGWGNQVVWVDVTPMPLVVLPNGAQVSVGAATGCGYATGADLLFKSTNCP